MAHQGSPRISYTDRTVGLDHLGVTSPASRSPAVLLSFDDRSLPPSIPRVVVFTSPRAGSGAGRDQIPELTRILQQQNVPFCVTSQLDELQQHAGQNREPTIVVTAGGDGTVALAAQSISREHAILPMPMGTENLLARHFGHSRQASQVWHTIQNGTTTMLDGGLANGRLFLIMATCGFDAEVVRGMHLTRRGHISKLSYARPIFRAMAKYAFPKIRVTTDDGGEHSECGWAMAFNLPRYAGYLNIEPDADGTDGKLDLICFNGRSVWSGLKYVSGVALNRHLRFGDVQRRRVERIELSSDLRVPYQIDGDYVGRLPLVIESAPACVRLLVPAVGDAAKA